MFDGIIDALRGVARDFGLDRGQQIQPTPEPTKQIDLSPEQIKHIADNIDLYEAIDPEIGKKMREYLKTSLQKQGADNLIGPQPQADTQESLNSPEVGHETVTTLEGTPAINPDQINLTASQALINDYYRRGGGTYAGAARIAAQDGNDFNKIVAERNRLQGVLGYNKPVYVAKAVANDSRQPSQPAVQAKQPSIQPSQAVQELAAAASIPLVSSQAVSEGKRDKLKEMDAAIMNSVQRTSQKSDIGKSVVDMAKQGSYAIHRNQANPYVHY